MSFLLQIVHVQIKMYPGTRLKKIFHNKYTKIGAKILAQRLIQKIFIQYNILVK
jgi:hypothetical protein